MKLKDLQFRKRYTVEQILNAMQEECNYGLWWPKNVNVYCRKQIVDVPGYHGIDWDTREYIPFNDILQEKVSWSPHLRRLIHVCLDYDYYQRETLVMNIYGGKSVYIKLYWDKFYDNELKKYMPPKKNPPSAMREEGFRG